MRASIIYFVLTSLVNGPIITFAFPSAMNSMITVTPSKKPATTVRSKSININNKISSSGGGSSTEKPLSSSSMSPVSGSSLLPSSFSSHFHSTASPGASYSTASTHSTSTGKQQNTATTNRPGFDANSSSVSLSSSHKSLSDRSNNSSLPLTSRNTERKKKVIHTPSRGVGGGGKGNTVTGRGSRENSKITTASINQWTDHVNATTRGETNSLLSRVKRRGARGGGFGNAGRKGPRDRLDYRKNHFSIIKPTLTPFLLVTLSTILIVFST